MIFVFVEDGSLEIVSENDLNKNYEGIDVESGVYRFFDRDGTCLKPRFTVPNKKEKLLGIIPTIESGHFVLDRTKEPQEDSLDFSLHKANSLIPNQWFTTLDEVKDHFRKIGIHLPLCDSARA